MTLRDVDPPVWRRLVVPEQTTLHDLDGLLRAGMGWRGRHLSLIELAGRTYGDVEDMEELGDPRLVGLDSLTDGTVFRWDYDLGDGWEHDVRIEGRRTTEAPTCLDGAGACPPDDSGGPGGYEGCGRSWPPPGIPSTPTPAPGWGAHWTPRRSTRPR